MRERDFDLREIKTSKYSFIVRYVIYLEGTRTTFKITMIEKGSARFEPLGLDILYLLSGWSINYLTTHDPFFMKESTFRKKGSFGINIGTCPENTLIAGRYVQVDIAYTYVYK